ncbi:hypothetical protein Noda2021_01160 [Candidatus Dependentiae bacterium Noda2021]|nr:hypothetical protein Noda2021_01160 [Candidatus Dependentiae bacterium Noda2021]
MNLTTEHVELLASCDLDSKRFVSSFEPKKCRLTNLDSLETLFITPFAKDQITYIDASLNLLTDVPPSIHSFSRVISLNLSDNTIREWPSPVNGLTSLLKLNINNNFLDSIGDLRALTQLSILNLSSNTITSLCSLTNHLLIPTNLEELNISYNLMNTLPSSINTLTTLQVLDARCNSLTELPLRFHYLKHLHKLFLSNNKLKTIPLVLISALAFNDVNNHKYLDLSHNEIEEFEEPVINTNTNRRHVTPSPAKAPLSLNLSHNKITKLPNTLTRFNSVVELDLSHNKIQLLPQNLGAMKRLHTLMLSANPLNELPVEIGKCTALENLTVNLTPLRDLPDSIVFLTALTNLQLLDNSMPLKAFAFHGNTIASYRLRYLVEKKRALIANPLRSLPYEIREKIY